MYIASKRIIDIIVSFILLILLCPFLMMVAILLIINGMGNPIFIQKRSGKNNNEFMIYKFKTMNGDEISKFCDFLRKTGIDELPQLLNILKGDMSFIGPRPWILEYSKNFNQKQMNRLNVLPGLTGLAQVTDCKDIFEKIDKDIYYVNNLSFILDFSILIKTFKMFFIGEKRDFSGYAISEEIYLLASQVGE